MLLNNLNDKTSRPFILSILNKLLCLYGNITIRQLMAKLEKERKILKQPKH